MELGGSSTIWYQRKQHTEIRQAETSAHLTEDVISDFTAKLQCPQSSISVTSFYVPKDLSPVGTLPVIVI